MKSYRNVFARLNIDKMLVLDFIRQAYLLSMLAIFAFNQSIFNQVSTLLASNTLAYFRILPFLQIIIESVFIAAAMYQIIKNKDLPGHFKWFSVSGLALGWLFTTTALIGLTLQGPSFAVFAPLFIVGYALSTFIPRIAESFVAPRRTLQKVDEFLKLFSPLLLTLSMTLFFIAPSASVAPPVIVAAGAMMVFIAATQLVYEHALRHLLFYFVSSKQKDVLENNKPNKKVQSQKELTMELNARKKIMAQASKILTEMFDTLTKQTAENGKYDLSEVNKSLLEKKVIEDLKDIAPVILATMAFNIATNKREWMVKELGEHVDEALREAATEKFLGIISESKEKTKAEYHKVRLEAQREDAALMALIKGKGDEKKGLKAYLALAHLMILNDKESKNLVSAVNARFLNLKIDVKEKYKALMRALGIRGNAALLSLAALMKSEDDADRLLVDEVMETYKGLLGKKKSLSRGYSRQGSSPTLSRKSRRNTDGSSTGNETENRLIASRSSPKVLRTPRKSTLGTLTHEDTVIRQRGNSSPATFKNPVGVENHVNGSAHTLHQRRSRSNSLGSLHQRRSRSNSVGSLQSKSKSKSKEELKGKGRYSKEEDSIISSRFELERSRSSDSGILGKILKVISPRDKDNPREDTSPRYGRRKFSPRRNSKRGSWRKPKSTAEDSQQTNRLVQSSPDMSDITQTLFGTPEEGFSDKSSRRLSARGASRRHDNTGVLFKRVDNENNNNVKSGKQGSESHPEELTPALQKGGMSPVPEYTE